MRPSAAQVRSRKALYRGTPVPAWTLNGEVRAELHWPRIDRWYYRQGHAENTAVQDIPSEPSHSRNMGQNLLSPEKSWVT